MTPNVLVTGGAGFIGSHMVDALLQQGAYVTVLDNFSAGRFVNLAQHTSLAKLRVLRGDLLHMPDVLDAMAGKDLVVHLAAHSNIAEAVQHPELDLSHGLLATVNVLNAMRRQRVSQLVFASSGSIYGNLGRAVAEDDGPLLPISVYGASKLSGEAFISAYAALFGIRAWIFRFGNVVGNRLRRGVIHDFIQKLRQDPTSLEVLGDGRQTKPYLLVNDCVSGMLHGMHAMELAEQVPCVALNLAPRSTTHVTRIAEIVIDTMGLRDVTLRYTGGSQGWPGDQAYIELKTDGMAKLGWCPQYTSDEAVRIAAHRLYAELREEQRVA